MSKKDNKYELKNDVLEVTLEDGSKKDANILFTFNENGDQFIVYEIEEEVDGQIYGTAYAAKLNNDNSIKPIEEDEWEIVEKIFNEWAEENNKEEE